MLLLAVMRSLIQIEDMFSYEIVMKPSLVERRVLHWLQDTLAVKHSVSQRKEYIYTNLALFVGLVLCVGYFLYSKSLSKNNLAVKEQNRTREREYINTLVEKYKHGSSDLITTLPLLG